MQYTVPELERTRLGVSTVAGRGIDDHHQRAIDSINGHISALGRHVGAHPAVDRADDASVRPCAG